MAMVLTLVTHIGIFIEYSAHRIHYGILMALLIEKPSSPHPVDHPSLNAIEERCPLETTILLRVESGVVKDYNQIPGPMNRFMYSIDKTLL